MSNSFIEKCEQKHARKYKVLNKSDQNVDRVSLWENRKVITV